MVHVSWLNDWGGMPWELCVRVVFWFVDHKYIPYHELIRLAILAVVCDPHVPEHYDSYPNCSLKPSLQIHPSNTVSAPPHQVSERLEAGGLQGTWLQSTGGLCQFELEAWWWSPALLLAVDRGLVHSVTQLKDCWCFICKVLLRLLQEQSVDVEGPLHLRVLEGTLETTCAPHRVETWGLWKAKGHRKSRKWGIVGLEERARLLYEA